MYIYIKLISLTYSGINLRGGGVLPEKMYVFETTVTMRLVVKTITNYISVESL